MSAGDEQVKGVLREVNKWREGGGDGGGGGGRGRGSAYRSVFSPTETFHRLCNTLTAYSVAPGPPPRTANCQMPLRIESEQSFCRQWKKAPRARAQMLSEWRINAPPRNSLVSR